MAGLTMRGCRSWFLSAERHMKEGLCQKEMGVSESLTKPVPGASECTWHWTWPWLSLAWPTICCTFCPLSRQLDRFALFWIRWFALRQSADFPEVAPCSRCYTLLDSRPKDTPSQGHSHPSVTADHAVRCGTATKWVVGQQQRGAIGHCFYVFVYYIVNADDLITHKLETQK